MIKLISWTGWTKEDWLKAIASLGEYLAFSAFMLSMMFAAAYFG